MATPCTDGEKLFVPKGRNQVSFLFHELGHFLMHYPNGPDPGLVDPDVRHKSKWEAEACLFGRLVCKGLDLDPGYNDDFLYNWSGDASRIDYPTVFQKAAEVIQHYRTHATEDDFYEDLSPYVYVPQSWNRVWPDSYDGYSGNVYGYGNKSGSEGGETEVQGTLPVTRWLRG